MILPPEHMQRQYACDALQQREILRVDDVQVVPERIRAGEEVNQIVYYTFCPSAEPITVQGRMSRVVTFQGKEVFRDVTNHIEFKPGMWAIGVIIGIPKGAKGGTYTVHTAISYRDKNIEKRKTFSVDTAPGRR
jgi:hypothetical protein